MARNSLVYIEKNLRQLRVAGAVIMGLHQKSVITAFHQCPTVICLGKSNTGKTMCTTVSMGLISKDMSLELEHTEITEASLRKDIFGRFNLPTLLHDPKDPEVLKVLVENTYEAKVLRNCRGRVVPGSSAIVTCNPDFLSKFRTMDL